VAGTNTGRSPQLKGYYAYWEQAIFVSLNDLVLNGRPRCMKAELTPADTRVDTRLTHIGNQLKPKLKPAEIRAEPTSDPSKENTAET